MNHDKAANVILLLDMLTFRMYGLKVKHFWQTKALVLVIQKGDLVHETQLSHRDLENTPTNVLAGAIIHDFTNFLLEEYLP